MTKKEFIETVSKISLTGEDEFKANCNSPELIWNRTVGKIMWNKVIGEIMSPTKLILWDKLNEREAGIGFFTDQNGNHWMEIDPHEDKTGGVVTIKFLTKGNRQYEVREVEI